MRIIRQNRRASEYPHNSRMIIRCCCAIHTTHISYGFLTHTNHISYDMCITIRILFDLVRITTQHHIRIIIRLYITPAHTLDFIRSFVHSFIRPFVHSFIRSFVHSFIRSFVHSFSRSVVHSFVRSFVHSFIRSREWDRT